MPMRMLLVGGTGNLSGDFAELLVRQGHEVHLLTRGRSVPLDGCRVCIADRRDPEQVARAVRGLAFDAVVNFLGFEIPDVEVDHRVFRGRVGQYVFISSATVYAKPPARLPIRETDPLGNAHWDYARKKLDCERWLLERHAEGGFPVTLVRPSHTYSRLWVPNPVSSASYTFASRIEQGRPVFVPDDGETPWTLTAASDFAAGLAGLLGNAAALGEAFHITSDEALSWNRIVAEIADALGVESPRVLRVPTDVICTAAPSLAGNLRGDKAHPGVFDNAKIRAAVPGFAPRIRFRDGIRESVAWLRAHPDRQNLKPEVDAICEAVAAAWEATGRASSGVRE